MCSGRRTEASPRWCFIDHDGRVLRSGDATKFINGQNGFIINPTILNPIAKAQISISNNRACIVGNGVVS